MKGKLKNLTLLSGYIGLLLVTFLIPLPDLQGISVGGRMFTCSADMHVSVYYLIRLVFLLLGTGTVLSGWKILDGYYFHRSVLLVFGIAFGLSAIAGYPVAGVPPFQNGIGANSSGSLPEFVSGFTFLVLLFSSAFIMERSIDRAVSIIAGMVISALSVIILQVDAVSEITGRVIYLISFGWILYIFGYERIENFYDDQNEQIR